MARHPKIKFSLPPIFLFSQFFAISLILFSQFSPLRVLEKRYLKINYTIGSDTAVAFHWYARHPYRTMATWIKIGNRVKIVRTFYHFKKRFYKNIKNERLREDNQFFG